MSVIHEIPKCALGEAETSAEQRKGRVLLVLNTELCKNFNILWESVEIRVFADGASNRVYEKFHEKYIPNAICGDLDSIKKDVRSFYESKGVEIYHDACQDYDDMTKSINYITSKYPKYEIFVIGATGGNLTQEFANFNAFFNFPDVYILFLTEENVVISLGKGKHILRAPYRFDCGLIPLGGRCDRIVTKNLKWDVDGPLQYGFLISSSNEMLSKTIEVYIENGRVLWLFDLKRVHKDN